MRHEANKYYALLLLCLYLHAWAMGTNHAPRIYQAWRGEGRRGWSTVTENSWGERAIKERDNCEGVQRTRGMEGGEGTLFNFRDSRNAFCTARVLECSKNYTADRYFFGESLFEESISAPRAHSPAMKLVRLLPRTRGIMTVAESDRCANNCDPVAPNRCRNCTHCGRSYEPPEMKP